MSRFESWLPSDGISAPAPPKSNRFRRRASPPRGASVDANGPGNVAESPPKSAALELVEVEMSVKGRGFVVDGVDQNRSGAELSAASHRAAECVDEKVAAE